MQKCTENTTRGGITSSEYNPIDIMHIPTSMKFTNNSFKQQQMLFNRWLKHHVKTAENCQILCAKFRILFGNMQRKITTKFVSSRKFSLPPENFISFRLVRKYVYYVTITFYRFFSSQRQHEESYCYANTLSRKERSNGLSIASHQRIVKPVSKYSAVQQNNITATLSRALSQRHFADFEQIFVYTYYKRKKI